MKNSQKGALIALVIAVLALIGGGVYWYSHRSENADITPADENENIDVEAWRMYQNTEYGFEVTFPGSWKDYRVVKDTWNGTRIDETQQQEKYTGPLVILKNPQTTTQQAWQDIPIMVFTPDVWQLIVDEKLAVSAAPIGPSKIGQNAKYIFATPPRWYGFTDTQGWEEAVEMVKTFRALNQ